MANKNTLETFKTKYLKSDKVFLNSIANLINKATSTKELNGIYSTWGSIINKNL
jgi:hypothetical protein